MRQLSVVEHQPVTHFLIEQGHVGVEQILVVVNVAFLDAAIKSLAVRIHFWGFRVRLPMHHLMLGHAFCEVPFELTAVVCQGFSLGVVGERVRDGLM